MMDYLISALVAWLAIYGAMHLVNESQIRTTHRKIVQWGGDPVRVQHFTGCADLLDWLSKLETSTLKDDVRLAEVATIAALLPPIDSTHNQSGTNRVRFLGQKLRESWGLWIDKELKVREANADN